MTGTASGLEAAAAAAAGLAEGQRAGARWRLAVPAPIGLAGDALGKRAGSSLEFQEHREYQPGDDLRHLDWAAYGRSDRLVVKRFREGSRASSRSPGRRISVDEPRGHPEGFRYAGYHGSLGGSGGEKRLLADGLAGR